MRPPLSYRLTDRLVFGISGIDVRTRLALDKILEERLPNRSREERKEPFLRVLPLSFGNKFPYIATAITIIFGAVFVLLAPDGLVRAVLHIHSGVLGVPSVVDYGVLALQWLAFYVTMSVAGTALTAILAFAVYGARIAKA